MTEVYFDDLTIDLQQKEVVQKDDYYPFGLTFNSFSRPGFRGNEFLYQGKEALAGVDWYDFHARGFHPHLGRFMQLDPMYNGPSGYVGMANNPISTIDPNGKDPITLTTALIVAAAVSSVSYTASIALSEGGFDNWDWGYFAKNIIIGQVSAGFAYGVGSGFIALEVTGKLTDGALLISKATAHATLQGGLSAAQGNDFLSTAGSAFVGSLVGSAWDIGKSSTYKDIGSVTSSMLLGGATSELGGGDFWKGAAVAGIVAGANELAHGIQERSERQRAFDAIKQLIRENAKYNAERNFYYKYAADIPGVKRRILENENEVTYRQVYKGYVQLKPYNLSQDFSFTNMADPDTRIGILRLFTTLDVTNATLTSYEVVPNVGGGMMSAGPGIIFSGNGVDYIFAVFKSMSQAEAFKNYHYNKAYDKVYTQHMDHYKEYID